MRRVETASGPRSQNVTARRVGEPIGKLGRAGKKIRSSLYTLYYKGGHAPAPTPPDERRPLPQAGEDRRLPMIHHPLAAPGPTARLNISEN